MNQILLKKLTIVLPAGSASDSEQLMKAGGEKLDLKTRFQRIVAQISGPPDNL